MLPLSTYRLQIRAGFTLDEAAETVDYLARLGADWVYLSPLLQAEPGSDHGYDVVDHSRIDPDRGGAEGLSTLSASAHEAGLGVLVDIVPNHVGVATPELSPWWWDLLRHGQESRYAEAFDVDWDAADGKVRIPVLADAEDDTASELDRLEIDGGLLVYYDNRYPIAPGAADDGASPREVHDRQHYELVNWRRADAELNYRRFFAVNSLAGIRVEVPWVFDESHAEIARWFGEGLADGLRVDHPDGLAAPGRYLDELAVVTRGAPVWVEKILEGDEQMPSSWATAGTTGYDALAGFDRIFVDRQGRRALGRIDEAINESAVVEGDWAELIHGTKRGIADGILRSEVLRLARLAPQIDRADDAIAELLTCFPVYRSYLPFGAEYLDEAVRIATASRPDLEEPLQAVAALLGDADSAIAIRFQQTSGMVMAKGVEDTAFYRYSRLTSLNEVGADPSEFSIDLDEFHRRQHARQATLPASMTTLSTHDTKRGEDVRARISALSERADQWAETVSELHSLAGLGDGPVEHLLWEAIVGSWPASRERLHAYAEKAAREAGSSTTWTAPDQAFEQRLHAAVDAAFDDERVRELLETTVAAVQGDGWSNSLGLKLVQITAPGIPDVYQGSELWETSLVDPDNRRPVDFALRRELLTEIDDGLLPPIDETGAAKLLVTSRALRLRRDHPERFSRYLPVAVHGRSALHAIAFDRGDAVTVATRLPLGLDRAAGWGDTSITLAERPLVDVITGREFAGGSIRLSELLETYPVALLTPVEGL